VGTNRHGSVQWLWRCACLYSCCYSGRVGDMRVSSVLLLLLLPRVPMGRGEYRSGR